MNGISGMRFGSSARASVTGHMMPGLNYKIMELKIFNEVEGFKVPRKRLFKVFQRFLRMERIRSRFEVNLVFAGEKMMRHLNETWKGRRGSTDVLSFEYGEGEGREVTGVKRGEIYICVKVAKKNALEFGKTLQDEILNLFAHGLLHLKGYTHETDKKYEKMMKRMGKIVKGN